ncbi:MAG: hypothetical protein Q9181_002933 [Wetmoreana brouardii]
MSAYPLQATSPPTSDGLFMKIPPEIRWQVYTYLLRPADRIVIDDLILANPHGEDVPDRSRYAFREPTSPSKPYSALVTYTRGHSQELRRFRRELSYHPKIMQLSRRIRKEATDCFYGQNLYFACRPGGVEAFLKDKSAEVLSCITNVTLLVPSESGRPEFMSLCRFIGSELRLRRLDVRINTWHWEDQPWDRVEEGSGCAADLLELDWVNSLLLVTGLESLSIAFEGKYAAKRLTVGAELTGLLQARMLSRRP